MQIIIKTIVQSRIKYIEVWKDGVLLKIKQTKYPLKETVKILHKMRVIEA